MTEEQNLIEQLTTAVKDLVWLSESDYPFEAIYWQLKTIDVVTLLAKIGRPSDTKVEVIELDTFFATATQEREWYDEEELENVKRYRNLIETLVTNLQEIKVYRVGEIEIEVYLLGKSPYGAIAGLKTKVIET